MNKKIATEVAVGAIVIIAIIVCGYFWLQNQPKFGTYGIPIQNNFPEKENTKPDHYIDVIIDNLSPKYDGKRVCLYGDFSVGFEHIGFWSEKNNSVWVNPASEISDSLPFYITPEERKSDIGCGIVKYSEGSGHMGYYNYELMADIIINGGNDTPYLKQINALDDCQNIYGPNRRDICYYDFAVKNNKDEICDYIVNDKIKSFCLTNISFQLSNSAPCEKITSKIKKENYEYVYYPIKILNPGITFLKNQNGIISSQLQEDGVLIKNFCYAVSAQKEEKCFQIINPQLQTDCFKRVAFQKGNPDICAKIESDSATDKMFCYGDLAIKMNDFKICERLSQGAKIMPDGSGRYINDKIDCFAAITARAENYEVCDRLSDKDEKNSCLRFKK